MNLTPQGVDAYKKLLSNPKEYNLPFLSLTEIFEECKEAIAKHIVFEKYLEIVKTPVSKIMFYIVMDGLYKQGKAANGDLGYCLNFKNISNGKTNN